MQSDTCSTLYGLRTLALCRLPVRSVSSSGRSWQRRSLRYTLEVVPHHAYGVPYGQDRLILILLATLWREQGRGPSICFGPVRQLLETVGLAGDGRNYQRFRARLLRVTHSTFVRYRRKPGGPTTRNTIHVTRKPVDPDHPFVGRLALSREFRDWLDRESFPISRTVVVHLANSPANLDFYQWILVHARSCRRRQYFRFPLDGEKSLKEQLGVSGYRQARDFRRKVFHWLASVKEIWPECPATVAVKRDALLVYRGGFDPH